MPSHPLNVCAGMLPQCTAKPMPIAQTTFRWAPDQIRGFPRTACVSWKVVCGPETSICSASIRGNTVVARTSGLLLRACAFQERRDLVRPFRHCQAQIPLTCTWIAARHAHKGPFPTFLDPPQCHCIVPSSSQFSISCTTIDSLCV